MADELCGPSNALQSFQKHTTVDRTLQQDRLTARQSPSQGFRSSPAPGSSLLESEFEAFQAGQLPFQYPVSQGVGHVGLPDVHTPASLQSNLAAAAWSSDFQRLTLSAPGQQLQPHGQIHPQQLSGDWQNEFAHQQAQPQNQSYANNSGYNGAMYQSPQHMYRGPLSMAQPQQAQAQPQTVEAFDEEAFARAFDEAAKSETSLVDTATQEQHYELSTDILLNESAEKFMSSSPPQQDRIGADTIRDPAQEGPQDQQQDPDALAMTAGQLLDRVGDNQSEKFQNSQFLKLMRQLRDREMVVEGDKIVARLSKDREAAENAVNALSHQVKLLRKGQVQEFVASSVKYQPMWIQFYIGGRVKGLVLALKSLEELNLIDPSFIEVSDPLTARLAFLLSTLADEKITRDHPSLQSLVSKLQSQFSQSGFRLESSRKRHDVQIGGFNLTETRMAEVESVRELTVWMNQWLESLHPHDGDWLISPDQLRDLLGPELFTGSNTITKEQFDMVADILGVHLLDTMVHLSNNGCRAVEIDDFASIVEAWSTPHTPDLKNISMKDLQSPSLPASGTYERIFARIVYHLYYNLSPGPEFSRAAIMDAAFPIPKTDAELRVQQTALWRAEVDYEAAEKRRQQDIQHTEQSPDEVLIRDFYTSDSEREEERSLMSARISTYSAE